MEKKCADRRCEAPNFTEEEDDDEALSLSDLPLIHQPGKNREEEQGGGQEIEAAAAVTHEEFDFCSFSKESEMCAADEVFFQGQILPLRHSISSDKGCSSRSESMDHYSSGRLISSRSSSTSSGSSSATGGGHISRSRLPPRNQFHSHPSPSPRLSFSNHNQRTTTSNRRKSSVWNILRLGLVATPPEIALHDLKTRGSTTNCTNFGSRNSTSSNSSSVSSSKSNKKKKKGRGLLGGCKCSMDAVDTVASRVVIIKRSASENDVEALQRGRDQNVEEMKPQKLTKKHMSHHRTFEWLKQLSVEGTADES